MSLAEESIDLDYLPFYVTAPGESDLLFSATVIFWSW